MIDIVVSLKLQREILLSNMHHKKNLENKKKFDAGLRKVRAGMIN